MTALAIPFTRTANVAFLPNIDEACARIVRRAKAEGTADLIAQAQRIIDDPRGYTDPQLRKICAAYMDIPKEHGGGGAHYLRADEHIFAIDRREKLAAHRAARLAVEARETSARIALRHLPRWPALLAGAVSFTGFWWGGLALVMGVGG
jgi:hypothetical protein